MQDLTYRVDGGKEIRMRTFTKYAVLAEKKHVGEFNTLAEAKEYHSNLGKYGFDMMDTVVIGIEYNAETGRREDWFFVE